MADESIDATVEVWKPLPGCPGYEASNLGRIRSIDRIIFEKRLLQFVPIRRRGRVLKLSVNPHGGHLQVNLANKTYRVPGLVMRAFVGECPPGLEVCHGDGDETNNRLDNMRYDTRLSNHADRKKHRGPQNPFQAGRLAALD
jgi:hypothetical protein